jgi:hypothetical protein
MDLLVRKLKTVLENFINQYLLFQNKKIVNKRGETITNSVNLSIKENENPKMLVI